MGGYFFHIFGDIDDFDCLEGTFFDTDAASDAEDFADVDDGGLGSDFNAYFFCFIDGTSLFALLFAPFGLALFRVDDGDSVFIFHAVEI